MMIQGLVFCCTTWIAADVETLTSMMVRIAADGCVYCKSIIRSYDAVRSVR